MKNAGEFAKKIVALLRKNKSQLTVEPPPKRDALTQLVIGFLQWDATRKMSETAYAKLMAVMVDHNDLRVSHAQEIVSLIGPRYPKAEERAARLRDSLNEIFNREHATALESLTGKSKRDVRAYLESLPGMPSFVSTQVELLCFGGSHIPIDETTAMLLKAEGVVDADATLDDVSKLIENNIKAEEAAETHLLLQAWADSQPRPTLPTPVVEVHRGPEFAIPASVTKSAPAASKSAAPASHHKPAAPAKAAAAPAKPAPSKTHKKTTKKPTKKPTKR